MGVKKGKGKAAELSNKTPEFGGDARALTKFAEKQVLGALTGAVSAVLRNRPKQAGVFLATWLQHSAVLKGEKPPEEEEVTASLTWRDRDESPEKRSLRQALVEPVDDELELGGTLEELMECETYLNEHLRPLLIQALKCGMRARSEDMVTFVQKFLCAANNQLVEMRLDEAMLKRVDNVNTSRREIFQAAAKAAPQANDEMVEKLVAEYEPTMTPIMQLKLVQEQVEMYIRSSVQAVEDTLAEVAALHNASHKDDKAGRNAARDVPALQECIHLAGDSILGSLEVRPPR